MESWSGTVSCTYPGIVGKLQEGALKVAAIPRMGHLSAGEQCSVWSALLGSTNHQEAAQQTRLMGLEKAVSCLLAQDLSGCRCIDPHCTRRSVEACYWAVSEGYDSVEEHQWHGMYRCDQAPCLPYVGKQGHIIAKHLSMRELICSYVAAMPASVCIYVYICWTQYVTMCGRYSIYF